jgi:Porin PorA
VRRIVGLALVLVGAFLVGSAAMARFYLPDRLAVTPIDQYAHTNAVGPGSYLDGSTLTEKSSDLVARRTLRGDVAASTNDVAVWDVSVVLETGDGQFVRATLDRVATDRRTGEAVNCCSEAVDSGATRHSGVSYKFPFDTQKKDYAFWDPNSKQAPAAKFVSEEKVQGLTTYKFLQVIAPLQIQTQVVPGSLVGETAPSVQAPVFYSDTRTVWIEPRTGVIVKGTEQNKTTLRDSAGQDKATVLQYDLTFDDATQKSQAKLARDGISKIRLVSVWLPLLGLVLGIILILAGVILLRASDRARPAGPREEEPVEVG